ncbi:hypothetical protein KIW84_070956 [Lathyrus oleraceus]|uniref:Uncharacterized protein n=1 Tax=Pisum sativum TaxID=3888 RepID=A0A9D4ZSK9_PEA|nr:hypothetical protein KIW84_070956 [Pisum sativum]
MGRRTSTGLVLFAWLGKRELPECKAYLAFTQLYDTSWYQHMKAIAKTLIRHQQDRTRASIYSTALTAFFLMKGPKTQGRVWSKWYDKTCKKAPSYISIAAKHHWNGAESLDLEDGIELYFLFLIREEGHRLIGGSIQDNYRAECLERAERFPFSRVTWPIGLLGTDATNPLSFILGATLCLPGFLGPDNLSLLGSVSSNLYLEHLRILLNWSTPLPYCLVRTGIPIPKATDSDSVIKPEPSEESMSL